MAKEGKDQRREALRKNSWPRRKDTLVPPFLGPFPLWSSYLWTARDPRSPWSRGQEDLPQGIQGVGQGAKKVFTNESKALAKEARKPSSMDPRLWLRRRLVPRDPRNP